MAIDKQTEIKNKKLVIKSAIGHFLDDNGVELSSQNIKRLNEHLISKFDKEASISSTLIHNYLQEVWDYNEFNIKKLNSASGNEDAIANILITSDITHPVRKFFDKYRKFLLIAFVVLSISIFEGVTLYNDSNHSNMLISFQMANDLTAKVKEVVAAEKIKNPNLKPMAIWNRLKNDETILKYGKVKSYKDFNYAQYDEAMKLLGNWLIDVRPKN